MAEGAQAPKLTLIDSIREKNGKKIDRQPESRTLDEGGQKLDTRFYKLEKLVKWEHIEEVNQMLMDGVTPRAVSTWCADKGFIISHPKLYEYKDMLQEAITKNVTVERLLGVGMPKRKSILLQALGGHVTNYVKNEMELLDQLIHLGMSAVAKEPEVKIETAMKAIELKNKLTGGKHAGLTMYGLDQLRELEKAKMDVIVGIVLEYLPEERHAELTEAISAAEREFYETQAPELLEQYEESLKEDIEDPIKD